MDLITGLCVRPMTEVRQLHPFILHWRGQFLYILAYACTRNFIMISVIVIASLLCTFFHRKQLTNASNGYSGTTANETGMRCRAGITFHQLKIVVTRSVKVVNYEMQIAVDEWRYVLKTLSIKLTTNSNWMPLEIWKYMLRCAARESEQFDTWIVLHKGSAFSPLLSAIIIVCCTVGITACTVTDDFCWWCCSLQRKRREAWKQLEE